MVWSITAHDADSSTSDPATINYNTYVLGREGYFELCLITDSQSIAAYKPTASKLLDSISYGDGKRYADFNPDTDHMAEYGLAALITGVAAKKLGLLAIIGAFVVKFAKIIIIGAAVFLGSIKKVLGGSKS